MPFLDCSNSTRNKRPLWNASDLHALLQHQLDAEVEFDLTHFGNVDEHTVTSLLSCGDRKADSTFGRILTSSEPSLEMLDAIRRFAKSSRKHGSAGLPEEVATVLYYAAIAAARLRHEASISKLSDDALLDGLEWARRQPWMVDSLAALFAETIETVRSGRLGNDV